MKIKMIATGLLICVTGTAQAGFFDSLFGGKEEAPVAEVKQAEVDTSQASTKAVASESTSVMDTAVSVASGLIPTLTSQLGVNNDQAQGGMGALLNVAKGSLSGGEFSSLSNGIPGMETLLAAAPALSGKSSMGGLSGIASSLGGSAAALGGIGQLTSQFEALGLSPEMISQFAKVAIDYFMNNDVDTGNLLQKGLGSILG